MARSHWKGSIYQGVISNYFTTAAAMRNGLKIPLRRPQNCIKNSGIVYGHSYVAQNADGINEAILLYRRNQAVTTHLLQEARILKPELIVYNGYDMFDKEFNERSLVCGQNLSQSVLTREYKVVHKSKLSKAARRMQETKKRKSTVLVSKTGAKRKVKKTLNKNIKRPS